MSKLNLVQRVLLIRYNYTITLIKAFLKWINFKYKNENKYIYRRKSTCFNYFVYKKVYSLKSISIRLIIITIDFLLVYIQ